MKPYALILAGGEGKRFWPLSRKSKPKQFLTLFGGKSLISHTVERILPVVPIENIFVVTLDRYAEQTLAHLPKLPPANLVLEPAGRNTAPAIAVGTLKIRNIEPDAVTIVLPADHAIGDEDGYRRAIVYAAKVASEGVAGSAPPLVTLGVQPLRPETGYGYIKSGRVLYGRGKYQVREVLEFTEKPDIKTASDFLRQGGYYWNSGIFIWRADVILQAFAALAPGWSQPLDSVAGDLNSGREGGALADFYRGVESAPIDKLILERWGNTTVIPVDFQWSDIGSWESLDEFLRERGGEGNVCFGDVAAVQSSGCLVLGDGRRVIAMVGVQDLVVVEAEDAILILDKRRSQDIRKLVEELEKGNKYT
ncbi:MAG: mannose-1-phosphate guanylyltransferase [Deltaproteobacteria bacterium]